MSKGRLTEQITSIIEDTLQGAKNITITHDTTLKDIYGNDRQIDVLIEYNINDRAKFKTIIECKYKGRDGVEVNQMQSFKALLDSLKDVDQGIFVSTNGFQKAAVNVAEANGIKLYSLEELNEKEIKKWMMAPPVIRQTIKQHELLSWRLMLKRENADLISKNNPLISPDDYLIGHNEEKKTIREIIEILVPFRANQLHNSLHNALIDGYDVYQTKYVNISTLPLNEGTCYESDGKKIPISHIELRIKFWFEYGQDQFVKYRLYKDSDENPMAEVFEADIQHEGNDIKLGVVKGIKNDKEGYYFYDGKKNRIKLEIDKSIDVPNTNTKVVIAQKVDIKK